MSFRSVARIKLLGTTSGRVELEWRASTGAKRQFMSVPPRRVGCNGADRLDCALAVARAWATR